MTSFLSFTGMTCVLLASGWCAGTLVAPRTSRGLRVWLSLPLGTLCNVLMVFVLIILSVPLVVWSIVGGHVLMCLTLAIFSHLAQRSTRHGGTETSSHPIRHATHHARSRCARRIFLACAVWIIASVTVFSFAHAVLLPTFQYDSATNWTMRSKISFVDQRIAFDATEERGMAKPGYPFLFHALQIAVNQGQTQWSDTAANAILWLLSVTTFVALLLLIRRAKGWHIAVISLATLLSIPLLAIHLAQGYADIVFTQEALLAMACLAIAMEERDAGGKRQLWLLSGLFVSACVWTKAEGLFFALVPWLVLLGIVARTQWHTVRSALVTTLALSLPWPIFAVTSKLQLTPHSSDTLFAFHPDGLAELWPALFARGSFGIGWYAVLAAMILCGWLWWTRSTRLRTSQRVLLLWPLLFTAGMLVVYLCTPNVTFLLNAEAFYRQMMTPLALFVLGGIFVINVDGADTRDCATDTVG